MVKEADGGESGANANGGNTDSRITLLLHDHSEASQDARYRDGLVLNGFYFSLAVFAALMAAVAGFLPNFWLSAIASFVGGVIFIIFRICLGSLRGARNAAWARRAYIEKHTVLWNLVRINDWIVNRRDEDGCKREKRGWENRRGAQWVNCFILSAACVWFAAFVFFVHCGLCSRLGDSVLQFLRVNCH